MDLGHSLFAAAAMLFSAWPAAAEEKAKQPVVTPTPSAVLHIAPEENRCLTLAEARSWMEAVDPCREALMLQPFSRELSIVLANVELEAGFAARSAALFAGLVDRHGWDPTLARGQANALWRMGDRTAAERLFGSAVERSGDLPSYLDLARFLASASRWEELDEMAERGLERHPQSCDLAEARGNAAARQGDHQRAAGLYLQAVDHGCPSFRWTVGATDDQRVLEETAYAELLTVERLVTGLREAGDGEVLHRLGLLKARVTPEAAMPLAQLVVDTRTASIRLASLGLLQKIGFDAEPAWSTLLASNDFVIRKQALRAIRPLADDRFLPLLDDQAKREEAPRNRTLLALMRGELRLSLGERQVGETLLRSIPVDDPLHLVALTSLSVAAEEDERYAEALALLEQVRELDPRHNVDEERLIRLHALAGNG